MRAFRTIAGARLISLEQLVVAALNRFRLLIGLYFDLASRTAQGVLARGGSRSVGRSPREVFRDALDALRLLRLIRSDRAARDREITQVVQRTLDTLVLALGLRLHFSSRALKVFAAYVEGADAGWFLITGTRHTLLGAALRALRLLHSLRLNVAFLLRRILGLLEAMLDLVEALFVNLAGPALGNSCLQ